ncbi:HD family phosphohydrolase [Mucisphaera calidilacus]|uniref:7TM receptor with intracellular HD hydrolase n=1 Tax=Mucisphaera calidilacus TaxID=2527982 RepID=A0A518BYT7_9BACT|nr:HDIG domain-containing metalloprotein [Mucisphaera calidilacus]QDU72137.1 7TM receptor with intracellular HD hydrolase [Mucisphaera calidilacus]
MAKQTSARRREVRKTVSRERGTRFELFRNRATVFAVLFTLLLGGASGLIAVSSQQQVGVYLGALTTEPVIARVAFEVINEPASAQRRENAANAVPNVYRANDAWLNQVREELKGLPTLVNAETTGESAPYGLNEEGLARLADFASRPDGQKQWDQQVDGFLRRVFTRPVLAQDRVDSERTNQNRLTLLHPDPSETTDAEIRAYHYDLLSVADTEAVQTAILSAARDFNPSLRRPITTLVVQRLRPIYQFDESATRERRDAARLAAAPQIDTYASQQVLVPASTRLTEAHITLIEHERAQYKLHLPIWAAWLRVLGVMGVSTFIAGCLWFYAYSFQDRIRRNPTRGLALIGLILLCQLMPAVALRFNAGGNTLIIATGFAVSLSAIILALVYGQRFALAAAIIQVALIGLTLKLNLIETAALLAAAGTAIALLQEVRHRSAIVRAGLYGGLAMLVMMSLVGLSQDDLAFSDALNHIAREAIWAGIGVGLAGIVVQSFLPQVERLFQVTTAMTLKELNDASHPLLQRLAQEAPGTYQHSLRIADMAEGAADAIGADGLLCRVGSMYHDIGKIHKPSYFIENQGDGPNRHDKLSPAMSLLIIVGHVKDGIEMAKEYRLPTPIRQFIETHHGTTLVEYFFHAAKKKSEASGETTSEFEFRYPGPKPQSKEAAIMLLCDGIEGAARAMADPNPIRLEQIVHTMASKRLNDGQFDECSLTLQDLSSIEKSITKTLQAMYHGRIKYPEKEEAEERHAPPHIAGQASRI